MGLLNAEEHANIDSFVEKKMQQAKESSLVLFIASLSYLIYSDL